MGLPEDEIKQRIAKVTRELRMDNLMGRNIFKLSGGEKQRVACASVSAMQPEIFVLDEPTSNLDLDAIEELKQTLLFWKKQGKTIVIAEHRLYWLKDICDRVIYMEEGHVVSDLPMKTFVTFSEDRIKAMGLRGLSLSQPEFPEKPEKSGKTITFKNYHFNYEKEEVLHMSDVTVPAESIIAVTGHNGAGKSTFLRCLCGLEKKFKGHTVLDGVNLSGRQMLKNCYMVMQDVNHQLFCETVEEEIQLGMAEEKADKVSD